MRADDGVEDPQALRRAEEAVSHREAPFDGPTREHIDEPWTVVATQDSARDSAGLDDVVRSLESDGIDVGWDPYDPRDAVDFMPPDAGLTARRLFSVVVPQSQAARARESLYGVPPQGVTYAWPAAAGTARGAGFDVVGPAQAPVTSADPHLSDNERLQRLAAAGLPSGAVIVAVALVLVGGVIVAFLLRG